MRAVLHDYAQDMVLPALEVYTHGLMTDSTMYDAFLAQRRRRSNRMTTENMTSPPSRSAA